MDIFNVASRQSVQPAVNSTAKTVKSVTPSAKTAANDHISNKDVLKKTIEHLNKHMDSLDTNIKFGFDDKVESMFVNVMERSTGKIIRRIPTEEAMKISEKMKEIVGMIFDKKG